MINDQDQITSSFPGNDGSIWWVTNAGKVGTISRPPLLDTNPSQIATAEPKVGVWIPPEGIDEYQCPSTSCPTTGIVKGIAVDESGAYVVTNTKLYKFIQNQTSTTELDDPGTDLTPLVAWEYEYKRGSGKQKPGMQSWGSGTSPKLFGNDGDLVIMLIPKLMCLYLIGTTVRLYVHRYRYLNRMKQNPPLLLPLWDTEIR